MSIDQKITKVLGRYGFSIAAQSETALPDQEVYSVRKYVFEHEDQKGVIVVCQEGSDYSVSSVGDCEQAMCALATLNRARGGKTQ